MPLDPAFRLSATNPRSYGYDPEAPDAPFVSARIEGFGISVGSWAPFHLPAQVDNDELILGCDPSDPADENDITVWSSQIQRRSVVGCYVYGSNVRDDQQYLFVFGFKKRTLTGGALGPYVQFFVGTEWVQTAKIDDQTETVALLVDAGPGTVTVWARLAASIAEFAQVGFTGVEGFII